MADTPAQVLRTAVARMAALADVVELETGPAVPDCCGESHTKPGLLHDGGDGCGGWLTTYRDHGTPDTVCTCFDRVLAAARQVNATEEAPGE